MYRIKNVNFNNHPVLGNLKLDFCDLTGKPVDTVIIAGENGTGKSTIIDCLYRAVGFMSVAECEIVFCDEGGNDFRLVYYRPSNGNAGMYVTDNNGVITTQGSSLIKQKYPFKAIFSDVDINFKGANIQTISSSELDVDENNRRSSNNLPTEIKQLIVDIQSLDDSDTAESFREAMASGQESIKCIKPGNRMNRFTNAFNRMFEGLTYSRVINKNNNKTIIFTKGNQEITIDELSSGEKQIVYRGCFLLRDKNSLEGAFVFIDEPEISLHPDWQKKILNYYKGIFTDDNGIQSSQIFVVTHSPFIIHNNNRNNDKVLVLKRDNTGKIVVKDKPEYYECNAVTPIQDAFNVNDFTADVSKSIVYLEGRTDEKYFNKALEVFGYLENMNLNFEFQWIGHMKNEKDEEFSGASNMSHAENFIRGRKPIVPQVFLYDCDTDRTESDENNVVIMCMPKYSNAKKMDRGIENALELECLGSIDDFYEEHSKEGHYGTVTTRTEFKKMKFCNFICGLDTDTQRVVLANLKQTIDKIIERVNR